MFIYEYCTYIDSISETQLFPPWASNRQEGSALRENQEVNAGKYIHAMNIHQVTLLAHWSKKLPQSTYMHIL